MSDKINLKDMTLREIGELKCRMAARIDNTIKYIVGEFSESYDFGDMDLSINTDIREFRTECGEKVAPSQVKYNIGIKFSKEDE